MDTTTTTTTKGNEMTQNISDGRRIEVQSTGSDHAIVVIQPDGSECIHHFVNGKVEWAIADAQQIARGIEFDISRSR